MTRDGGGWTLGLKSWYQAGVAGTAGTLGGLDDALSLKDQPYKLSDDTIRDLIGPDEIFDVLADQEGFNSSYSTGNLEYVVVRGYEATWRFDAKVEASASPTLWQSYRAAADVLVWSGELGCGYAGWGINCVQVLDNNPAAGAGCLQALGKSTNSGWHHFAMSWSNTDTYLYICNGPQHSSGRPMNHRFWFREAD